MDAALHALAVGVAFAALTVAAHQLHLQVIEWVEIGKAVFDGTRQ